MTPVHQLHLFTPGKGVGVESGNLCGDTSFVGRLVFQAPPWAPLGLAVPLASPQIMRVHGTATWVGVSVLPTGAPCTSLSQNIQQSKDCLPDPAGVLAPRPYHWLTLLGGRVNSAALAHIGGGVREPCPAPLPLCYFPTAHEVSLVGQMYTYIKGGGCHE